MERGRKEKTDGRGMRQYNYGQHCFPKNGTNGVSRARRIADKATIEEEKQLVTEEKDENEGN